MANRKKFHLEKREACPDCGSVALKYRKKTNDYLCMRCHNIFDTPIIVERLHNSRGQCIERPVD